MTREITEGQLERALEVSPLVRRLVAEAVDLELSKPPTLTNAEAMEDPETVAAWDRVDEALIEGGF
jgi:hypothetical protein